MPAYPESLGLEIELHGGRRLAALFQLQVQQPIAAHRRGQPGNVIAAGTYLLRFRRRRTAVAMRWYRESNSVDVRALGHRTASAAGIDHQFRFLLDCEHISVSGQGPHAVGGLYALTGGLPAASDGGCAQQQQHRQTWTLNTHGQPPLVQSKGLTVETNHPASTTSIRLLLGHQLDDQDTRDALAGIERGHLTRRMVRARALVVGTTRLERLRRAILPGDRDRTFQHVADARAGVRVRRNLCAGLHLEHGHTEGLWTWTQARQVDAFKHSRLDRALLRLRWDATKRECGDQHHGARQGRQTVTAVAPKLGHDGPPWCSVVRRDADDKRAAAGKLSE